VILGSEETIAGELANWEPVPVAPQLPTNGPIFLKNVTRKAVRELEGRIILSALQANCWNRKRAARDLRISYRALLYKIRQAGLPTKRSSDTTHAPTNVPIASD